METINLVDFAVIGLLLVSALIGIARGFTREVLGIFAWVGALFVALYGLILMRPLVSQMIGTPFVADVVSGLLLFIIALFILGTFSRNLSTRVKGSALGGLDRSLGFVFGLARGSAIVVIGYMIATFVYSKPEKWPAEIKAAKTYPYVVDGAEWMKSLIPSDINKKLGLDEKKEEEGIVTDANVSNMINALSQPKPAAVPAKEAKEEGKQGEEEKKDSGYSESQRDDMERLVKTNE